ncbi:MAG: flagellar export protein FliJ [Armatimonadota bacterium]
MKKFKFNLQRVLDYRQTIEDKLLAELAAVQAEHERELVKLEDMKHELSRFREKMKVELSQGSADEIKESYNYLQQLTKQVLAQQLVVSNVKEKKDQKTLEVVDAAKERKALERLKEYKVADYKKEADRQEQKFLDEIAGIRFGRTRAEDFATGGRI